MEIQACVVHRVSAGDSLGATNRPLRLERLGGNCAPGSTVIHAP